MTQGNKSRPQWSFSSNSDRKTDELLQFSDNSRVIRARPVPHFGVPNIVQNVVKPTQPEPFSFLERDMAM
jgi:hypothetical protein